MNYKLFDYPHKAIRNLLFRISTGLTTCLDFNDFEKTKPLLEDLKYLLDNHLNTENEIIVPHLSSELIHESDSEHDEVEGLQQQLFDFLFDLNEDNYIQKRDKAELMFNHFLGKYLLHMHHEETAFQEYVWNSYDEQYQSAIVMNIVKKFSPEENWMWMKYGLPYVSPELRMQRLIATRSLFSDEQYNRLVDHLKEFIDEKEFAGLPF